MNNNWDTSCDVVVVGSGAAGLTGAITASHQGLDVLVVEKLAGWGGTTAYSGGGMWIPDNYLMAEDGARDSFQEALQYLEAIIEDVGPASSRARKEAYLRRGPEMVELLRDLGMKWSRVALYPDYYPFVPGAKTGRIIEAEVFNARKLGDLKDSVIDAPLPPMAFGTGDAALLPIATRTWKAFRRLMGIMGRTIGWHLTGKIPFPLGKALVGNMMHVLQSNFNVPIWLETPLKDLVMEDSRVVGVVVEQQGEIKRIQANRAVLLAAGGFAKNDSYRRKFQPVGEEWSSAPPGDEGDAIRIAEKIGAALAMMEQAWWGASMEINGEISFSVYERSLPGSMIVDQTGQRFANESTSYVDLGEEILRREAETGKAVPSWMVFDARYRKRYLFGMLPPGYTPQKLVEDGSLIKADSLDDLARQTGMDGVTLKETIEQFNSYARHGIDKDFRRGDGIYDRFYSDPTVKPNPNLAPLEKAPFWAVRVYPGDLGTKGGLLTDEYARVLRENNSVIEGLYASGNSTASVMGGTYPGPGASIGPAATFSYIGMRHAAGEPAAEQPGEPG